MAISLNKIFNTPTREESERKAARGQATVDRISEMQLDDELRKGQMEYAKKLGVEFDEQAYQRARDRELKDLRDAGDKEPEKTRAKAKSGGLLKEAFGAILSQFGIDADLPQKSVKRDAAKIEEDEAVSTLGREKAKAYIPYQENMAAADNAVANARTATSLLDQRKAEAYTPYQGTLADVEVGKQVSGAVRDWQGNDRAIELGPLSGQAEAAGLAAKRDEARNYVGQFEQRKLENEIGLLQAQMRQQFLGDVAKDPLQLNLMMNPKLQPADFGRGTSPQILMDRPMTPLGQTNAPAMQRPTGPQTKEQRLRSIMEGLPVVVQPKLQD